MRKHTLSFTNAYNGIISALAIQANLKIHFSLALFALVFGYYLKITTIEYLVLIVVIGTVIVAEMSNTSIEHLADAVTLENNQHIKMAKDVAAGSVLLTAIVAILVGCIIFIPKLLAFTYQ